MIYQGVSVVVLSMGSGMEFTLGPVITLTEVCVGSGRSARARMAATPWISVSFYDSRLGE